MWFDAADVALEACGVLPLVRKGVLGLGPLSDLQLVMEHISFDVTTKSLFYAFKDFHLLPHGSALNEEHQIIKAALNRANVGHLGPSEPLHNLGWYHSSTKYECNDYL